MKINLNAVVLSVALIGVLPSQSVRGCTCVEGDGSLEERFKQYQAVFVGTVVEMKATMLSSSRSATNVLSVDVTFKIHEALKGVDPATTTVVVTSDIGMCGFPFEFGWPYLVSATRRDGKLYAHLCGLTKPLGLATAELTWLRQAARTRPEEPAVSDAD